jgi:apolipoprotein N-acyltransferase
MLRATNTGITAVIDQRGHIVRQLPQFVPGALDAVVEPRTGMTPYIAWGNLPVISLALLMILAGVLAGRRSPAR